MNTERISPEDFARLIALPEEHPERRDAARSPEFQARLAMLREFERPSDPRVSDADAAAAGRVLEARLAASFPGAALPSGPRTAAPRAGGTRSLVDRWFGSAPRMALSFAALVIVAASVTWIASRPAVPRATRGAAHAGLLTIAPPKVSVGAVTLSWDRVAGADGYRLVFYGADMNERARLDMIAGTTATLRAGALPAGLAPGTDVLVEVTALEGADPVATSAPRLIRLP